MASELIVQTLKGPTSGDNANKVIIPSGQTLDINAWTPPAGTVLQVVQVNTTTSQSTTSASYVDATGLSVNITPSSASNKILVMANLEAGIGVSGQNTSSVYRVVRDSATAVVSQTMRNYDYGGSGVYSAGSLAMTVLDAPNTTSSVNYKVQFLKAAGDNMYISAEGGWSTLTVTEIAG